MGGGLVGPMLMAAWRICFDETARCPTTHPRSQSSHEIDYAPERLAVALRGGVVALAHVRGGDLLGRPWGAAGRRAHKQRGVHDYAACARHLVAAGIAAPGRLVAHGRSAGGFLVGAALNLTASGPRALFAAAILEVPFVDALCTMLDASAPLTVPEYAEWGDPAADPAAFAALRAVCPVTNVRAGGAYPPVFLTAGLHDARVGFWEPLKVGGVGVWGSAF